MAAMTICAGTMILMHFNESFFWVVSGFTRMEVGTAYKTLTAIMAIMVVVVFAFVAFLGLSSVTRDGLDQVYFQPKPSIKCYDQKSNNHGRCGP